MEATLAVHHAVAEVAVVGAPHATKGEGLWAFVTPDPALIASDVLAADLKGYLRREMGEAAVPEAVIFGALPKTAAGEVVRPVLQRIAATGEVGDTSGLADPAVAEALAKQRAAALA
nr:hypothetical protein [Phenylobacterium sp.]